jgi:uncharacterized protein YdeI (YjbR/CyaY-like superfamily)
MSLQKEYQQIHPLTRLAWREWLAAHHQSSPGIWFVYYKKETGKPRVSYDEAVEEALCFGWIDSLPRKLDAERTMLKFTPRKPKSVWSELNKKRVARLIKEKKMMPAGIAVINVAKKNGSWHSLTVSDTHASNNTLPDDLAEAFAKNKKAFTQFTGFSPSIRKQFLSWIDSAKQPATRQARVKQTVLMAAAGKKPGAQGFKL